MKRYLYLEYHGYFDICSDSEQYGPKFRNVGITLKALLVGDMVILQVTHVTHHSQVRVPSMCSTQGQEFEADGFKRRCPLTELYSQVDKYY